MKLFSRKRKIIKFAAREKNINCGTDVMQRECGRFSLAASFSAVFTAKYILQKQSTANIQS